MGWKIGRKKSGKHVVTCRFTFSVESKYNCKASVGSFICSPNRGRDASNTGSGPEFFGFSHPTIQYLIQSLPGARKCIKYQWVKFELPKPQSKQG